MATQANAVVTLLRAQYKDAHETLEGTMQGVTPEQTHWLPTGTANPLGATYVHVLTSEDGVFNGMLQGGAPLLAAAWAGKMGLSEMPPTDESWDAWAHRVQVDLVALSKYGQAVYAATDEYLAGLSDQDLDRPVDLASWGMGEQTLGWLLSLMMVHIGWHTGEIACLKGLQGAKGYPF
jgi:uncharacterized damage-inducible protein DinB